MSGLPVAMVVVPMITALVLLLGTAGRSTAARGPTATPTWARRLGLASLLLQLGVAVVLLHRCADGQILVHRVGNWPAPYAIVLVADRLGATMVAVTAVLAPFVHLAATGQRARLGPFFHPLLHLQLMGLHGAFLTGDLFNLFVWFEVLLIASYGLLLSGGGRARLTAGLRYIVLNLVGSSLFLVAVGIVYGVLGTLNLAQLAIEARAVDPSDVPLLRAGGTLLLVVFGLKAALAPLHLWLPATYQAAPASVAALFAIMTKVGIYAILRVHVPLFGPGQGAVAGVIEPWLLPAGLLSLSLGTLGVLASTALAELVAFLLVASVGTIAIAVGLGSQAGLAAALYYLAHSTWLSAGLFLLSDAIAHERGPLQGRLSPGPRMQRGRGLALLFLVGAAAAAGLPPISGFVGKVMVLDAASGAARPWVFGVVLVTSVLTLVQLARAGSVLFWEPPGEAPERATSSERPTRLRLRLRLSIAGLLLLCVGLGVLAGPAHRFARATAAQLGQRERYFERVLGDAVPTPKTRAPADAPMEPPR